jgi:hypothetical protein
MFTGHMKHPSMILEVVASRDLWIWHAYFGMPGSCNDINVLQKSLVFSKFVKGEVAPISFNVNGHTYDMGYYLAYIYPNWPAFVKTVCYPTETKHHTLLRNMKNFIKILSILLVSFRLGGLLFETLHMVGTMNILVKL